VTVPVIKSTRPTLRNKENRAIAMDLIVHSNKLVTSFAKQMVTTSLSSVGVILAIAKYHGVTDHFGAWAKVALALTCAGCVIAALVFAYALMARRIRVTLDDYSEAPSELLTIAHQRQRLATLAFGLLATAIVGAIAVLTVL